MSEYSIPVAVSGMGQPTLPAEAEYGDLERLWISEQPKNLWPENQNSNLGAIRKTLLSVLQGGLGTLDELALEAFVTSSAAAGYLGRWEAEMGLPVAPTGKTESQRRSLVLGRIVKGAYTRARRAEIVESHLQTTFGAPIELTPGGVPFSAGGIPIYGEGGAVSTLYRIYEDPRNFSYEVRVKDTVDPDFVSLTRELAAIKPAWITQTISEVANVLSYEKAVVSKAPIGYWRMPNFVGLGIDHSGNGNTPNAGTATEVSGLINSAVAAGTGYNPGNALDFNGTSDYLQIPNHALYSGMAEITLEAWTRMDALPAPAANGIIFAHGNSFLLRNDQDGRFQFYIWDTLTSDWSGRLSSTHTAGATIYHVVAVKRRDGLELWINGVRDDAIIDAPALVPNPVLVDSSPLYIGGAGGTYYNGVLDEMAIYNHALTPAEILDNYNTGRNIP